MKRRIIIGLLGAIFISFIYWKLSSRFQPYRSFKSEKGTYYTIFVDTWEKFECGEMKGDCECFSLLLFIDEDLVMQIHASEQQKLLGADCQIAILGNRLMISRLMAEWTNGGVIYLPLDKKEIQKEDLEVWKTCSEKIATNDPLWEYIEVNPDIFMAKFLSPPTEISQKLYYLNEIITPAYKSDYDSCVASHSVQ